MSKKNVLLWLTSGLAARAQRAVGALRLPVVLMASVALGLFAASLLGATSHDFEGFRLGLSARPSLAGRTDIAVPPLGEVSARTHTAPVRLVVTIERLYIKELGELAKSVDNGQELLEKLDTEARALAATFIMKSLLLAAIASGLMAFLLSNRKWRVGVAGLLAGLAAASLITAAAYFSFDVGAFRQPQYHGALSAAPWMMDSISSRLADLKEYRQEMRSMAVNIGRFFSRLGSWEPASAGTTRVLHVSDIHNNPAAFDLITRIVAGFRVDVVIDTGDITDFGTPLEASFLARISDLGVPYLFVPGNHDSPQVVAALKKLGGVRVLDTGKPIEVEGLKILGIVPSPFLPGAAEPDLRPDPLVRGDSWRARLGDEMPFIVATHYREVGAYAFRFVPVVLVGHSHRAYVYESAGHVLADAGTTGAAGLRTFKTEKGVPYSLELLEIEPGRQPRLVAIDTITVYGLEREFTIERRTMEAPVQAGVASADTTQPLPPPASTTTTTESPTPAPSSTLKD